MIEVKGSNGASAEADRTFAASPSSPAVSPVPASIPSACSFYATCRNCGVDRHTCERRAQVRAGVKGLGLTSIKFRCDMRRPLYHPGQRVEVTWKYYPADWEYDEGYSLETWPATVIQETKKGFLISVDDVPSSCDLPAREYIKNENLYCNVVAGKLSPLTEEDRPICAHCKSALNTDGTVTGCWSANGYDGIAPVTNCLAQAMSTGTAKTPQAVEGRSPASAVFEEDAPNPTQGNNQ
jgi:hypothetical protein